jgi:hypothetical protein
MTLKAPNPPPPYPPNPEYPCATKPEPVEVAETQAPETPTGEPAQGPEVSSWQEVSAVRILFLVARSIKLFP